MPVETMQEEESINITSSYSDILNLNTQEMKDLVIVIKNMDGTASLSYKIFGTAKQSTNPLPLSDDSWVNILDMSTDPADYDHTKFKTIPPNTPFYEAMTVKWFCIKIQAKSSSGTITGKCWLRGLY